MTAREKCIKLAKEIAKKRDGYKCQKCGRQKPQVQIQGAHILPVKTHGSLAADPYNIIAMCATCHMWGADSWHESPLDQWDWFNFKFPGRYDTLKQRDIVGPIKNCEWEEKLKELKKIRRGDEKGTHL